MFAKTIRDGLDLRLIEDRHVPAVFECVRRNLDHLRPWMPWATDAYSLDGCRAWQRAALERFARNEGFVAGVFEHGDVVGTIGFHALDWANRSTSIGYWLDAAAQGRGVMTAACRAMVDHAVGELGLNRVEIRCGTGNVRSRRVPSGSGSSRRASAGRRSGSARGISTWSCTRCWPTTGGRGERR
jgi:ribosomal-protein-serine acetyltransferase